MSEFPRSLQAQMPADMFVDAICNPQLLRFVEDLFNDFVFTPESLSNPITLLQILTDEAKKRSPLVFEHYEPKLREFCTVIQALLDIGVKPDQVLKFLYLFLDHSL